MMVHNIDNWSTGAHSALEFTTGSGPFDNSRADMDDLIELVVYELEQQRHLIQLDSHDMFCEQCQEPMTRGCDTTNRKLDGRISELRRRNDHCKLCGAKPMTTNCNNGRCDD